MLPPATQVPPLRIPSLWGARSVLGALRIALAGALLCMLGAQGSHVEAAQFARPEVEYKLKAAFVAQFVRYVQWPEERFQSKHSPFVVGVLGADPFGSGLTRYLNQVKEYQGHPIEVRHFENARGAGVCHLLFVAGKQRKDLPEVLTQLRGKGVLAIGEDPRFAQRGGVVNFYWRDPSHIAFEINVDAAKRRKLTIRSQLLKLAKIVKDAK